MSFRECRGAFALTVCVVIAGTFAPLLMAQTTYYVSPSGDDTADGTSPDRAWRTAARAQQLVAMPGDQVLFQRGGQWWETLAATGSGSVDAPVVYGAYGSGDKPIFWGSDSVSGNSFQPVEGTASTYRLSSATPIGAAYADGRFMIRAASAAAVSTTPNSWFYDSGELLINSGTDPRSDGRTYEIGTRGNVVYSNYKSNVVFRDLVVRNAAMWGDQYAFYVVGGRNVTIEDCEAHNAGKHHVSALNTHNFTGRRIITSGTMPGLAPIGGSSALVSYSDWRNSPTGADTAQWIDCVVYGETDFVAPAFYRHGSASGNVLIKNLRAFHAPISTGNAAPGARLTIEGGVLENAGISLYGTGDLVDGVTLKGPKASIYLGGRQNVVQNVLLTGSIADNIHKAVVTDRGRDNVVRFSTLVVGDQPVAGARLLLLFSGLGFHPNTLLAGNILAGNPSGQVDLLVDYSSDQARMLNNLYAPDWASVYWEGESLTFAQWLARNFDPNGLSADPRFVNPTTGNYGLRPDSPAIDRWLDPVGWPPLRRDLLGMPRPQGRGLDLGAFELPEPGSLILLMASAAVVGLRGRHRA